MDLTELALEHIDGNERRLIDGVLCRAVDRRIAQRHVLEVIDRCMHADHCRDDVHAADNIALPDRLRAEDQSRWTLKDELQGHIVPIRHNADLIAREDQHAVRVEAGAGGKCLADADSRGVLPEHPQAQRARKAVVRTRDAADVVRSGARLELRRAASASLRQTWVCGS